MKQEALSAFQYGELSSVAMILFMFVFIGFIYFAYNKRSQDFFDQMSKLPLSGEEDHL